MKRREEVIKRILAVLGIATCLLVSGCASIGYNVIKPPDVSSNEHYEITINPIKTGVVTEKNGIGPGFNAIEVSVFNKTDQELIIDWDRAVYIEDGRPNGGFLLYKSEKRKGMIQQGGREFLAPSTRLNVIAFPTSRAIFIGKSMFSPVGFFVSPYVHEILPPGETGIVLTVGTDAKMTKEKITFTLK